MTSAEVRSQLVQALNIDLIGPDKDSELQEEVLPHQPSRWYLTGFLIPIDADEEQAIDESAAEEIDNGDDPDGDETAGRESANVYRPRFPSSMGLSVLLHKATKQLQVIVRWGDYEPLDSAKPEAESPETEAKEKGATAAPIHWRRTPHEEPILLDLPDPGEPKELPVPNSKGLLLVSSVRPVPDGSTLGLVPKGTRAVSVYLINRRKPGENAAFDKAFAFQASLEVRCTEGFVARPNLRGLFTDEWDECVADLQYRDTFEYAVGHNVSTRVVLEEGGCREVHTCWVPTAEVERVAPADIASVELGMEALSTLSDGQDAWNKLGPLVTQYRTWIGNQQAKSSSLAGKRKDTADALFTRARAVADRIEAGIKLLADPMLLNAFRLANKVMAVQQRRRRIIDGVPEAKIDAPKWRPFQLAFVLMNLRGIVEPNHADRDVVDLLFFPTGGGKTEAYLGLAAFILILRRLRNPGIQSAGLSVLMRYTLRLLTLDQLSRAATLVCALELERKKDVTKLGEWPFEIGLWVGSAATPNIMGYSGDGRDDTARMRTRHFQIGKTSAPPIPLDRCPWCGTKFTSETARDSFVLLPDEKHPTDLRIVCSERKCAFIQNNPLPIVAVDEPIYRRLPCFLIATVDKFAAMPWTGQVGGFFGRVDRYDKEGFYGPCDKGSGLPIPGGSLQPPDLVIQDELHLISGPLGTMVGLYEAALDELCSRKVGDKVIRPKIIASTATVRQAKKQIQALFCRSEVDIFPPPGPDIRDTFFAHTHSTAQSPARLYVGIAALGRSPKRVMLRTYLTLMAAQKAHDAAGGKKNLANPADPYMTLLGYFNSLRELGGARRIVEDEINSQLRGYARRKRESELAGLFADREIGYDVLELTSRVTTDKVADARRRLALPFDQKERVDVALATNMISVGLDISRLGMMVVFGQPKTSAEYIQATSRVGRDVRGDTKDKPGLVVTVLNPNRPRDRSHYERFAGYHLTFYRNVEATSVTPFSARAMDRGLAGTVVALARLLYPTMTPPKGAFEILKERGRLLEVITTIATRAACHEHSTVAEADDRRERVRRRVEDLLDAWETIAKELQDVASQLQYQKEAGSPRPLLRPFLDPELRVLHARHKKFRANRSMRDVEPSVGLWIEKL